MPAARQVWKQAAVLHHIAHRLAQPADVVGRELDAAEIDRAGVGPEQSQHEAQQGALPAAARTDEDRAPAACHGQRDRRQDRDRAERLRDLTKLEDGCAARQRASSQ